MLQDMQDRAIPHLSEAALNEWGSHVEAVLRGIAHALNNRAAALSAVIELSEEPAEEPEVIRSILETELDRVQALAHVVRIIGAPRGGTEAFAPADAAAEALAVLDLHSDARDRGVTVEATQAAPIRVARWLFVRALVALAAGLPPSDHTSGPATITLVEDGEWLVARITGAGSTRPSALATELARAMDGEPLADPGGYGFRIPTLAALRRREGH